MRTLHILKLSQCFQTSVHAQLPKAVHDEASSASLDVQVIITPFQGHATAHISIQPLALKFEYNGDCRLAMLRSIC